MWIQQSCQHWLYNCFIFSVFNGLTCHFLFTILAVGIINYVSKSIFSLQFLLIEILISVMIKYFVNDLFKRKNTVYYCTAHFLLLEFGTNLKNLGQNLKVFLKKKHLSRKEYEQIRIYGNWLKNFKIHNFLTYQIDAIFALYQIVLHLPSSSWKCQKEL